MGQFSAHGYKTKALRPVMPGLVPGIHEFPSRIKDVDGRAFARRSDRW
jgi:hypothetical protein